MREISEILRAYHKALLKNKQMVLATAIKAEGSSCHSAVAIMLISKKNNPIHD